MLERRARSDRLRKILTYYDQNKFIFTLPATLKASIGKVCPPPPRATALGASCGQWTDRR